MDDDEDVREANAWCLRAAGWNAEEASCSAEARFAAARTVPDAVVIDLLPSEVESLELIRRLRRDDSTMATWIVACASGDRLQVMQLEFLAATAGSDAFLAKPFRPEELRDTLRSLAAQRKKVLSGG